MAAESKASGLSKLYSAAAHRGWVGWGGVGKKVGLGGEQQQPGTWERAPQILAGTFNRLAGSCAAVQRRNALS